MIQGLGPLQCIDALHHQFPLGVGQLGEVFHGDVCELDVVEVAQHGMGRGRLHGQVVVGALPQLVLLLVTPRTLLSPDVLGPSIGRHADQPIGRQPADSGKDRQRCEE